MGKKILIRFSLLHTHVCVIVSKGITTTTKLLATTSLTAGVITTRLVATITLTMITTTATLVAMISTTTR